MAFLFKFFVLSTYILSFALAEDEVINGNGCKYKKKIELIIQQQFQINERLDQHYDLLQQLIEKVDSLTGGTVTALPTNPPSVTPEHAFSSCAEAYESGFMDSGKYTIRVANQDVEVSCDMSDGGGWTVFQRRMDGSVDFFRNWNDYKNGFGSVAGEHWLGNDILAAMTAEGSFTLRVDGTTFADVSRSFDFTSFKIGDEEQKYKLTIDSPNDSGQGMSQNNGEYFSTLDRDNDDFSNNCAEDEYEGGWWYSSNCGYTNLNGPYRTVRKRSNGEDIFFHPLDSFYTIKFSQMKFRPTNFGDK